MSSAQDGLFDAARGKDNALGIEEALRCISQGADVNGKDHSGRTPLHGAVIKGNAQLVKLLLAKGALPSARDRHGKTPLHVAVEKKATDIATLLVDTTLFLVERAEERVARLEGDLENAMEERVLSDQAMLRSQLEVDDLRERLGMKPHKHLGHAEGTPSRQRDAFAAESSGDEAWSGDAASDDDDDDDDDDEASVTELAPPVRRGRRQRRRSSSSDESAEAEPERMDEETFDDDPERGLLASEEETIVAEPQVVEPRRGGRGARSTVDAPMVETPRGKRGKKKAPPAFVDSPAVDAAFTPPKPHSHAEASPRGGRGSRRAETAADFDDLEVARTSGRGRRRNGERSSDEAFHSLSSTGGRGKAAPLSSASGGDSPVNGFAEGAYGGRGARRGSGQFGRPASRGEQRRSSLAGESSETYFDGL